MSRRVLDTQDRHIRQSLIQLGWIPPKTGTVPVCIGPDHIREAYGYALLFVDEARKRNVDNRVLQERTLKLMQALSRLL